MNWYGNETNKRLVEDFMIVNGFSNTEIGKINAKKALEEWLKELKNDK